MEYVIEMLNITKEFPGIKANDNITVQLKKGEIHALLGENGAGKSTLMSILFGLYQPDEGCIKINGEIAEINDQFIKTVAKIYHESNRKVEGIALSCPGVIDAANGTIKVVVAYPYLQGICLTELISKACDNIKVSLENDAKCAGLAEAWIGSAQAYDDAIIVVLGTGIGGAIIKNKQIHHGAHLFAGEISTLIVDYDKETNQVLTWSDIASTTALCKRAAEALAVTSIDGRRVFELANNADEVVLEVLKNFCLDIAIQLYNLQYSYDPGVICIGGGISKQPLLINFITNCF